MKSSFLKIGFLMLVLSISCDNPDGAKSYSGLYNFSGNYKFAKKNPSSFDCPLNAITFSNNDFEISSNGRFKRKIYSLNQNNECVVGEILEGKITITHPKKTTPEGIVEYDNLNQVDLITLDRAEGGKHHKILIDVGDNSGYQYTYFRAD